jgi:hypothetical protein
MGRAPSHKKDRKDPVKSKGPVKCERQFPDCPPEMNETCKPCPLYKK